MTDPAPGSAAKARLDRGVYAVERNYALFGEVHGRAVPIGRDTLRQIVRSVLDAADIDPADCQGEGRECYVHPGCVKDGQCVLHRDHEGDCDWGGDERDGD